MSKEMTPNMLAALEEERQFQESHQKNKVRRVKIEKVNQAWLVRFLPVGLGSRNLWYVRQGQHWLNKQPIFCPRCVSPDFGGDPNAECPVCEMSDRLNAEDNEQISSDGFRLRANLTYLTYCLVYQIDPGRGEIQEMPDSEILKPWEFQHYKSSFDELMDYFRRGVTNSRPYSVLDFEKGNDFWATRTTKGTRLDRQDPGPIFEMDANYEKKLDQIFSQITQPKIKIPTMKELETFARKAEAAAYGESYDDGSRNRGRGRGSETDEADEPQERPGRRSSGSRPSRRMASAADDAPAEDPAAEEDQIPGAEVPARTARSAAPAAPARSAAPARPAATAARPVAPARTAAPAAAPAAARPAATAARPGAAPRPAATAAPTRPGVAARPATAARPVAARLAPAAAESTVDPEEDPGIAEEATDHAPAADDLPADDLPVDDQPVDEQPAEEPEPAEDAGDQEEPPAPVAKPTNAAPAGNTDLRQRLLNRVKRA